MGKGLRIFCALTAAGAAASASVAFFTQRLDILFAFLPLLLIAWMFLPFTFASGKSERASSQGDRKMLWKSAALFAVYSALGLFAYANVLHLPFFDGDDYIHLIDGRALAQADWGGRLNLLFAASNQDAEHLFRPLLSLPFAVAFPLFGLNVLPYHLLNLFFHILAAWIFSLLIFGLSRRFFFGAAAGAFFALHPLISRPVAWIATITHTFPTLIFLLAFYCLYRFRQSGSKAAFALCAGLSLTNMAQWELGMLLPVFFLILEFLFFAPKKPEPGILGRKGIHLFFFALAALYWGQILLRIYLGDIEAGRSYLGQRLGYADGTQIWNLLTSLAHGLFTPLNQLAFTGSYFWAMALAWIAAHVGIVLFALWRPVADRRFVLLGAAMILLGYLPAFASAQADMAFLDRSRLFFISCAGYSLFLASLLITGKKTDLKALAFCGFLALVFLQTTAANNDGLIIHAKSRVAAISQIEQLQQDDASDAPLIFIFEDPKGITYERERDRLVTAYAKRRFEKPDYDTPWYVAGEIGLFRHELHEDSGGLPLLQNPLFIGSSRIGEPLVDRRDELADKLKELIEAPPETKAHWVSLSGPSPIPGAVSTLEKFRLFQNDKYWIEIRFRAYRISPASLLLAR